MSAIYSLVDICPQFQLNPFLFVYLVIALVGPKPTVLMPTMWPLRPNVVSNIPLHFPEGDNDLQYYHWKIPSCLFLTLSIPFPLRPSLIPSDPLCFLGGPPSSLWVEAGRPSEGAGRSIKEAERVSGDGERQKQTTRHFSVEVPHVIVPFGSDA